MQNNIARFEDCISHLQIRRDSLVKLRGGINNHVFMYIKDNERYVIKLYDEVISSHTDKMKSEIEFLAYSNIVAPNYTPKLIQIDKKRRFIILEYISGKAFSEDIKPERCDIQKAIEFVHYLNSEFDLPKSITQNAADGFLRLSDHMKNIKTRFSS